MRSTRPAKANPPLIVDANGVLLRPIPLQFLQPIRRRLPQVFDLFRSIDDYEFLEDAALHIGRDLSHSGAGLARPEIRCSGVREAVNHASMMLPSHSFPGKGIFTPSVKTRRPPRTRNQAVGRTIGPVCSFDVYHDNRRVTRQGGTDMAQGRPDCLLDLRAATRAQDGVDF